jgi:methionyl-tRNA synthetase
MIANYCDGKIPSGQIPEEKLLLAKRIGVDTDETTISGFVETARDQFLLQFENLAFSRALEVAWSVIARTDKMITEAKPWDLAKDDVQRYTLNAVLYRAAETLRWLSVLLYPVIPNASLAIAKQLGLADTPDKIDPASLKWGELREGVALGDVQPIFPRIDKTKTMSEINQPAAAPVTHATQADAVGIVNFIEIDDFAKVDLRVGTVLSAERVPKADKLLIMKIDLNEEQPRQVLAGIAQYYEPEKLIGRKVVVVANLKPRKLRGYESQGMVVAASYGEEGRPVIATFTEDVPNGARLK